MRFRSSIRLSLTLIALALLFSRLGMWQLERKTEKEALFERYRMAPELTAEQAMAGGERFARVEARGHYDDRRHILLDNRIWNGRAGVHVLTPFFLESGTVILVDRGWLPLPPDRRSLPEVPTDGGPRTLHGRLDRPSLEGPRLGKPDQLVSDRWPQLVTYLEPDRVARALGVQLQPWVLELDEKDPSGFKGRQWRPAVMEPATHMAYAIQWFGLAVAAFATWLVLGLRRGAGIPRNSNGEENT